jgi:PKD repeat protein
MKKIYALVICLFAAVGLSAQCSVTFTYTTNGLTINATATGTGTAQFPAYGWDWGDAQTTLNQQTASHTYATAGTYTVCAYFIDVLDTVNCNAMSCQPVTVTTVGVQEANAGVNTINSSPNPFGASTTFNVNLANNADVEISVYDITGKKVETVKDGEMAAGQHNIVWTPENLAEGVYFVQMVIDGEIQTRKIVHTGNE